MSIKMVSRLLCLLFISGPFITLPAQSNPPHPLPFSATDSLWQLRNEFSDEFNSTGLDTAKWDNDVRDWGVWSWEPENVKLDSGYLHLTMHYRQHQRKNKTLFYTSGIIKSKAQPVLYGYFEARIKAASRFPGVCPAFWAYRKETGQWTEIDFVELTERFRNVRLIDTNTHIFIHPLLAEGQEKHEQRAWEASWDPRDNFHIYGCEWNTREIKWYVDGELIQTRANDYWHQPLDVVLSFGVREPLKSNPAAEGFPTTYRADYIRVWQRIEPDNRTRQ